MQYDDCTSEAFFGQDSLNSLSSLITSVAFERLTLAFRMDWELVVDFAY